MFKTVLKAAESVSKATKTKSFGDIAKAAKETSKLAKGLTKKKKKQKVCKCGGEARG